MPEFSPQLKRIGPAVPRAFVTGFIILFILGGFNTGAAQDWCEVGTTCDEYISRVTVADIDNPSSCVRYSDYTDLVANMELGQSYAIYIEISGGYSTDSGGVWIDWDNDFVLDEVDDKIVLDVSGGYGPYTGIIHVPGHVQPGLKFLRIRLCWNQTPFPCGYTTYGEIEDYLVMLTGNPYVCGDANGDGRINVADAVRIIIYVFRGGAAPDPIETGDTNCDTNVDVADAVYMINYVFRNGPEPCCP
jgi:hypothetical protein